MTERLLAEIKVIKEKNEHLEQIAWEMFQDIESAFVMGKFKPDMYAYYCDRLEAAGVETYGFKTKGEEQESRLLR